MGFLDELSGSIRYIREQQDRARQQAFQNAISVANYTLKNQQMRDEQLAREEAKQKYDVEKTARMVETYANISKQSPEMAALATRMARQTIPEFEGEFTYKAPEPKPEPEKRPYRMTVAPGEQIAEFPAEGEPRYIQIPGVRKEESAAIGKLEKEYPVDTTTNDIERLRGSARILIQKIKGAEAEGLPIPESWKTDARILRDKLKDIPFQYSKYLGVNVPFTGEEVKEDEDLSRMISSWETVSIPETPAKAGEPKTAEPIKIRGGRVGLKRYQTENRLTTDQLKELISSGKIVVVRE